jgi:hypothetical protein
MKVIHKSPLSRFIIDIFTMLYITAMCSIPSAIIYIILYIFRESLPFECGFKLFIMILVVLTLFRSLQPTKSTIVEK